jgi:hypothetical protein
MPRPFISDEDEWDAEESDLLLIEFIDGPA